MTVSWLFSLFGQHDMDGELQPGPLRQGKIRSSVLSNAHSCIVKNFVEQFLNKIQKYIQKCTDIQDKKHFGHNGLKHSSTNITQATQ